MSKIDPNAVLLEFNSRFGGENGIVDRPEEITSDAAEYFLKWGWTVPARDGIIDHLSSNGKKIGGFFRTDLMEKLCDTLERIHKREATSVLQDIYYNFYSHNEANVPPFVSVTEGGGKNISDKPDFRFIFLFVSHKGHRLPVIITPETIKSKKHPVIKIDGYVDSLFLVGKNDSSFRLNGRDWKPEPNTAISAGAKENKLQMVSGADVFSWPIDDSWPEIVKGSLAEEAIAESSFFFSPDFIYDLNLAKYIPYSVSSMEKIDLDINGCKLSLNQRPVVPLEKTGIAPPKGGVYYYYQGEEKGLADIPMLKEKLAAMNSAILETNALFGSSIDEVYIRESYAGWTGIILSLNDKIFVPTHELADSSAERVYVFARHEALHHVVSAAGLAESGSLISFYKDADSGFLSFISERNIFALDKGGRASAGVAEFCVSFLNAMMDIDNVEIALNRASPKRREALLQNLIDAAELMMDALPSGPVASLLEISHERLLKMR